MVGGKGGEGGDPSEVRVGYVPVLYPGLVLDLETITLGNKGEEVRRGGVVWRVVSVREGFRWKTSQGVGSKSAAVLRFKLSRGSLKFLTVNSVSKANSTGRPDRIPVLRDNDQSLQHKVEVDHFQLRKAGESNLIVLDYNLKQGEVASGTYKSMANRA